jgi:type I restriction enzyme, S subunit
MKYGLTETTVKKICAVFACFPEIDKAVLYGSRAKGNFKTGSDIDLSLCGEAIPADLLLAITSALDELSLPYTIDLSVFDDLDHAKLREHIERVGVVFYERAKQCAGMKKNWETKPFEECIEKVTYTPKVQRKDFLVEGTYPIISQEEDFINGYWNNTEDVFKVTKPVVIFGDHTKVLKYVDFDFVFGADGVKLLQPKSFLLPKFFFYRLQMANLDSLGYARHYKLLRELKIAYPSLPEQKRIVGVVDKAFAAISKGKENAEKNLRNVRELFESYLQGVFANPGDGWEEKKLGDRNLLEIIDGDRGKNYPKKSDFFEEGFCLFMNTKNVRPDGFNFETTMFINEKKDKSLGSGRIRRNDVIMTTRGTIGNLGIFNNDVGYDNIRINSGMLIFRPNLKFIIPEYLFEILRSGIIKGQIKKHVSGAAQPQLPIKTLVNFSFPVPKSLPEQRRIVAKLDELSAETKKLEAIYRQKLADLEELKKSILQKAFNGELPEVKI